MAFYVVAKLLGASAREIVFTSGATEANNLALSGLGARRPGRGGIVVGATEHASVRAAAEALATEGTAVTRLRLASDGGPDLEALGEALDSRPAVVAQMLVSNELGSLYPLAEVSRVVRARGGGVTRLHVDAIQALGKIDFRMAAIGADSVTLSAHKIHGPKGVGALVLAGDGRVRPLIHGGGQESGRRSGTENVAGIVGFGRAVELAIEGLEATRAHLAALRARLLERIEGLDGVSLLLPGGPDAPHSPAIVSLVVPGAAAEVWLHHLDARGVAVGTGSACQARKSELSPVLLAAGLTPREARGVLRLSFSRENTLEEVERAAELLREVHHELAALPR